MHIKNFEEQYVKAVAAAYPNSAPRRYRGVDVLLLRWEGAEMEYNTEIEELQRILEDQYHFRVEIFSIPRENPQFWLSHKIRTFCETIHPKDIPDARTISNKKDEPKIEDFLRIIYYAGYSEYDQSIGACRWCCHERPNSPALNWSNARKLFRHTDADILILLDCFDPRLIAETEGKGTTEVIAATNQPVSIPTIDRYSFTHSLIDVLEHVSSTPCFSVAMLHEYIVGRMRSEAVGSSIRSSPMPKENGAMNSIKAEPTYSATTPKSMQTSIVLKPSILDGKRLTVNSPGTTPYSAFVTISINLKLHQRKPSARLSVGNKDFMRTARRITWTE
ncbi:hypothetical protein MMC26_006585 [Xylographa opegraphella]|nr:hypothetical protein [Xylographa opegraphella]